MSSDIFYSYASLCWWFTLDSLTLKMILSSTESLSRVPSDRVFQSNACLNNICPLKFVHLFLSFLVLFFPSPSFIRSRAKNFKSVSVNHLLYFWKRDPSSSLSVSSLFFLLSFALLFQQHLHSDGFLSFLPKHLLSIALSCCSLLSHSWPSRLFPWAARTFERETTGKKTLQEDMEEEKQDMSYEDGLPVNDTLFRTLTTVYERERRRGSREYETCVKALPSSSFTESHLSRSLTPYGSRDRKSFLSCEWRSSLLSLCSLCTSRRK